MASPPLQMLHVYTPPLCLWKLVEQHVPLFEQEEVKSMLGSHIVDQSLELHNEIEMLLDIWRDLRDEQKNESVNPGLPEPPNQRERLIQEINFFVENVKEKAKKKGINPEHVLRHHSKDIIDYASDMSRPGSSIGRSSRSSDGRETPMMVASPERISRTDEVTDEIEAFNDKLNVNEFEVVCTHLRSTLEKEVEQLVKDLEFLQGCLDDEADVRDCITPRTSREPTLTELREERAFLEKELLLADNLTQLPDVQNRAFTASAKVSLPSTLSKVPLQPSPPHSRPSSVRAKHTIHGKWNRQYNLHTGKDSPLKASHDIFGKITTSDGEMNLRKSDSASVSETSSTPLMSYIDGNFNDHNSPNSPQIVSSNLPKRQTSRDRHSQDGALMHRMNQRHKTPSPSRIKVVNLKSIVDIHSEKKESCSVESESQYDIMTSPVSSNFSVPATASKVPDQSLVVRPTSADRFRKMVMGCRDGD